MSVHRRPQSSRQLLEGAIDAVEVGEGEAIRHSWFQRNERTRRWFHRDVAAKPFGIACIAQGTLPNKPQHVGFWRSLLVPLNETDGRKPPRAAVVAGYQALGFHH